jgi:hypothetical protein
MCEMVDLARSIFNEIFDGCDFMQRTIDGGYRGEEEDEDQEVLRDTLELAN